MILLDSTPDQFILLRLEKPMLIWIGSHEAQVKVNNKETNYIVFSPIAADIDSQILVDSDKNIFWRERYNNFGWLHARIYNIALNPSRYATVAPHRQESMLWRVMPFEHCLLNGLISIEKRSGPKATVLAEKIAMSPEEYASLISSADLLTTPNSPQELQWLK